MFNYFFLFLKSFLAQKFLVSANIDFWGDMYLIDNILVDEAISDVDFLCDLSKCKGACCTIKGVTGAPLLDEELEILQETFPQTKPYLSKKSLDYIENNGMWQGEKGDYSTQTINNRDCVFVFYRGDIAFCAIEQAYRDGKIDFKKPLSCHLFPIRVGDFGGKALYYERMSVCSPALRNGKNKKVKISDMTKEALVRTLGQEWYDKYTEFVENRGNY